MTSEITMELVTDMAKEKLTCFNCGNRGRRCPFAKPHADVKGRFYCTASLDFGVFPMLVDKDTPECAIYAKLRIARKSLNKLRREERGESCTLRYSHGRVKEDE